MKLDSTVRNFAVAALLASAGSALAGTPMPTFEYLGDIPGGIPSSYANRVTNNAVVMCTGNASAGERAARWTATNGMVALSTGQNPRDTYSWDMTADGSVFVGNGEYRFEVLDELGELVEVQVGHAYRWSQGTGMVELAGPDPTQPTSAIQVSNDGTKVYGTYIPAGEESPIDGVWTSGNGWQPHSRTLSGPFPADDTDGDGTYIVTEWNDDFTLAVGYWNDPDLKLGNPPYERPLNRAFRWTSATGMQLIDTNAPQLRNSWALGMTPDGAFIIGTLGSYAGDGEGFRWTAAGGIQGLGVIEGSSTPHSISDDGSIITINGRGPSGDESVPTAQIWTASGGLKSYKQFLIDAGFPVEEVVGEYNYSGYDHFLRAGGVSPNGRYILGDTAFVENDEEWDYSSSFIIDLGEPEPTCAADFNNDDVRDVSDLFAYINAWLAKTSNADFNNSSSVDVADLFAYINAWLAGC